MRLSTQRKGYVSVEVIIVAALILGVGLFSIFSFVDLGNLTMMSKLSKLDNAIVNEAVNNDESKPVLHVVNLKLDGFTLNHLGWLQGSYSGEYKNLLLPGSHDGMTITGIYQDAFRNKGLEEFVFSSDATLTRIHARAFYKNNLKSITFPDSLTRIDLWAFRDNLLTELVLPYNMTVVEQNAFQNNNIVKISIGDKLRTIGTDAFGINHAGFVDAYQIGGAGVYVYENGNWIKK